MNPMLCEPSAAEGVPTHTSARSAPSRWPPISVSAAIRPRSRPSLSISSTPGSMIGACPVLMALTFFSLTSMPTTWCPSLAMQQAAVNPT